MHAVEAGLRRQLGRLVADQRDPEQRRQMAYARASLFVKELADPAHAVLAYQAILEEYGDAEVDAYRALDELFEGQGRWSDFADTVERLGSDRPCGCKDALATAIITRPEHIPDARKQELSLLIGKYVK